MDPQNQPQFNPKIPISEVLKQEQAGFVPSAPAIPKATLTDVVGALQNNYNSANNVKPSISPAANPTPGATSATTQNSTPTSPLKIIKTYKSDAAEAVKTQQESVTRIAIAQEEQRRARGEEIGVAAKNGKGLLILAVILILLGTAAIPTVNYILNRKTAEVPVAVEKSIIPFDHQETLTLNNATRDLFLAALTKSSNSQPSAGNIDYKKIFEIIVDAKGNTTTQQIAPDVFASLIGPNMPSALSRSFDSQYMFGIDNAADSKPFILLKTSAYEQTFANMLKWENKMVADLVPVLNIDSNYISSPFTDKVVINKDVRAVSATDGTIVLLDGFLDNQTLIITTDIQTFQDISNRYVTGQFVQ